MSATCKPILMPDAETVKVPSERGCTLNELAPF